jgi:signal peptidase I
MTTLLAWYALAGVGMTTVAGGAAVGLLRVRYAMATVKGNSMTPTYLHGERLLVRKRSRVSAGDVIVFSAPAGQFFDVELLVKRVAAVSGDPVPEEFEGTHALEVPPGMLLVRSDAARGLDSRQLGFIDGRHVVGVLRDQRQLP